VLREENILENVNARFVLLSLKSFHHGSLLTQTRTPNRSAQLFKSLNEIASAPHVAPHVLEVRGKGLMVAVEFASPSPTSPHDPAVSKTTPKKMASRVAAKCVEKGLMILTTSTYEVVRFIPPLNITESDMKKGCEIFREAVEEVVREG
jgi:4-aminobutyrate aminotransferase